MSGLVCARELSRAGRHVCVVDKGRGFGGRMATRRAGGAVYDHGAQFFTVRDERFRELVDEMLEAGVVREWFRSSRSGHPRYCGVEGMSAIARYLARDITYALSTRITRLSRRSASPRDPGDAGTWHAAADTGEYRANALVITAPIPQALSLLATSGIELEGSLLRSLQQSAYEPCLALLGVPHEELPHSDTGGYLTPSPGVSWAADNAAKGISERPALTLHCTPEFSREHYDDTDEGVIRAVGRDLTSAGHPLAEVIHEGFELKRWRYARSRTPVGDGAVASAEADRLVIAGDAFVGPRVEGAALSGYAAASLLSDR
jgi:hypothetical protein